MSDENYWSVYGNDRLDKRNRAVCRRLDHLVSTGVLTAYRRGQSGLWTVCDRRFALHPVGQLNQVEAFLTGVLVGLRGALAASPRVNTDPPREV